MIDKVVVSFCLVLLFSKCTEVTSDDTPIEEMSIRPLWNTTYTDKLRADIFKNYDRYSRPNQHFNTTIVEFSISMRHIDILEDKTSMNMYSWITLSWEDTKLKWDPSDYGGLGVLHVLPYELWKPDLYLYNSFIATPIFYSSAGVQLYANGHVFWIVPSRLTALCNLYLTYWPYDTQTCYFKIGSWTSNGNEIDLALLEDKKEADMSDLITLNSQWEIIKTNITRNNKFYACCEEGYPDILVQVDVKRRSPAAASLIVTPSFVIITLTLISFWISPNGCGKLVTEGFTALVICSMLLYFTQKLPAMGDHVPLILSFYSSCLYILSFTMIESTIVIWIATSSHSRPLPWIIKQPLTGKCGSILGVSNYIDKNQQRRNNREEEMRDHQVTDTALPDQYTMKSLKESNLQQEWSLLAVAIDRIFFIICSIAFLILAITYSV